MRSEKASKHTAIIGKPGCTEKASFECCLVSTSPSFSMKQHRSSLINSFLSSVEQKYWLVGQGMEYLFTGKVQENLANLPADFQFHIESY